ncbi:unnamed protein product, partial [Ixodes pacificus]
RGPRFLLHAVLSPRMNHDSSSLRGPHLSSFAKVVAAVKSKVCPVVHAWSTSSVLRRVAFVEYLTSRWCSFILVIFLRPVSPMYEELQSWQGILYTMPFSVSAGVGSFGLDTMFAI